MRVEDVCFRFRSEQDRSPTAIGCQQFRANCCNIEGKRESQPLDWIASAQTSEGSLASPKQNRDIVIYQKLETGAEQEHDRKHEKENKQPYPVECTPFRLPLRSSAAEDREEGKLG
jgi:hypothetical protein